jgi:hypothetical protein
MPGAKDRTESRNVVSEILGSFTRVSAISITIRVSRFDMVTRTRVFGPFYEGVPETSLTPFESLVLTW